MANNGWHIVKALRRNGFDAELIINSADFGMALPIWEELELMIDPYNLNLKKILETYDLPEWIKIWWYKSLKENPLGISNLFQLIAEYDILHLHPPSSMYLQFSFKPYVVHEAGWIRRLAIWDTPTEKLGRRSYARADCLVWTNPDTYPLFREINCRRMEFVPFVVDPDQYRPMKVEKSEELLFFHPARQVYEEKGNKNLIHAFARFIQDDYRAKLRMVDWGYAEDVEETKSLIKNQGLEEFIEWVTPYTKPDLIKVYSECDAVFDQFLLGSGGTVCYEAMSCEAPVVIYLNHWNEKCFGEMPPVENARTSDQIYKAMVRLTDKKYRRKIGKLEKNFTMRHNHPDVVAERLISIYKEVYR
jgi:glycosyltransferase involved in cell wall biosynthesis